MDLFGNRSTREKINYPKRLPQKTIQQAPEKRLSELKTRGAVIAVFNVSCPLAKRAAFPIKSKNSNKIKTKETDN